MIATEKFITHVQHDPLHDAIEQINIDEITPKEALNLLYELKSKLKS